jgi:hypothetical protein
MKIGDVVKFKYPQPREFFGDVRRFKIVYLDDTWAILEGKQTKIPWCKAIAPPEQPDLPMQNRAYALIKGLEVIP